MEHQVLMVFTYKTAKYRLVYTDYFFLEYFSYISDNNTDIWLPVEDNELGIVNTFEQCLNQINKFLEAKK